MCYLVLGLVIEGISGMPFASYLSQVLEKWNISGIRVGGPWRADWTSTEVEYFHNREPPVVPSLHQGLGEVLPQYGGLAMSSAAAYGGLIANGTSLLQFMNVIETLAHKNSGDQVNGRDGDHDKDFGTFLSSLIKESLGKPNYESGCDWYGLGWDIQDKGQSWGHTGGMEGTSSVLFHHISGLSWALLLNSWAKDIDLNGVMKCAMSRVSNLNLFDCDTRPVREIDDLKRSQMATGELGNGTLLFSKDKSQVIVLAVEETTAYTVSLYLKRRGYVPTWINTIKSRLDFGSKKCPCDLNVQITKCQSFSDSSKLMYIIVFSLKTQQYDDFVLVINKNEGNIMAFINEKEKAGYIVNFIDSFCDSDGNIKFSAVLIQCETKMYTKRSVYLGIEGSKYVRLMNSWKKSHNILCQSVTEVQNELYVSSLLEERKSTDENITVTSIILYWVQIVPESFLTELSRKIQHNMNLIYAKFYNSKGEPWVSACWTSGHASNIYHRISMSKYGIYPELAEAASENIRLLSISEYEDEGVVYYAGVWYAK